MEITYSDAQHNELLERMGFLKSINTSLIAVAAILGALSVAGIALAMLGFSVIGVILFVASIPFLLVALSFVFIMSLLRKTIVKRKYKVFRVVCREAERIPGSPLWSKVEPKEVNGFSVFHFSGDPVNHVQPGEQYDIIVRTANKAIRFGIVPIKE